MTSHAMANDAPGVAAGRVSGRMSRRLGRSDHLRPPWTDEASVRQACTSCGDCLRACPEAILIPGPAGTPVVDVSDGACTFCAACVDACAEPVFRPKSETPWNIVAGIDASCLLQSGVECRSCTDYCDSRALRFDLRPRPAGRIVLDTDACTGCGACVSACPTQAITLKAREDTQ